VARAFAFAFTAVVASGLLAANYAAVSLLLTSCEPEPKPWYEAVKDEFQGMGILSKAMVVGNALGLCLLVAALFLRRQ